MLSIREYTDNSNDKVLIPILNEIMWSIYTGWKTVINTCLDIDVIGLKKGLKETVSLNQILATFKPPFSGAYM